MSGCPDAKLHLSKLRATNCHPQESLQTLHERMPRSKLEGLFHPL